MPGTTRRQILTGVSAAMALAPAAARGSPGRHAKDGAAINADQFLDKSFATKPAPALSMAVADVGRIRWAAAKGHADLELGVPASTSHAFPLGSVSKAITATCAARLATRGTLGLDAAISRWMPDLPDQHRDTTLRQLLTHRGGIRHYNKAEPDLGSQSGAIYMRPFLSDADVLGLFINDPLVSPPGTAVRYSSYGYTLASMVMAAAAGYPFLELVRREIGEPFGLSSLMPDDPWAIMPARAGQYMNELDVKALCASLPEAAKPKLTNGWANLPFNNPAYCWAGAGFAMTPSDAARFGAAMIASPGAKVTPEQRTLLFTPITAATEKSPPLGLGWRVDSDKKGRRRWHHAGATPGGRYLLAIYPDQRLSVAVAGNVMTMRMDVLQTAADLIDIFAS